MAQWSGPTLIDDVLGRWVPAAVLLLLVPLAGNGATPGQRAVLLTVVRVGGRLPSAPQSIVRFLIGSGGCFILVGLDSGWTSLWLLAHLVFRVFTRGHRGLTGLVCGLSVVDLRAADREPIAPPGLCRFFARFRARGGADWSACTRRPNAVSARCSRRTTGSTGGSSPRC